MIRRLPWAALLAAPIAAGACSQDADLAAAFNEPIDHRATPMCSPEILAAADRAADARSQAEQIADRRTDAWNRMSANQITYQRGNHLYLADLGADKDRDIMQASGDNWRWSCRLTPGDESSAPTSSHAAWGPNGDEIAYLNDAIGFVVMSTDITDGDHYAAPRPIECFEAQSVDVDRETLPVQPLFSRDGDRLLVVKRATDLATGTTSHEVWSYGIALDSEDAVCDSQLLLATEGSSGGDDPDAISGLDWGPGGNELAVAQASGIHIYFNVDPDSGLLDDSAPSAAAVLPFADSLAGDDAKKVVGDVSWFGPYIIYSVDKGDDEFEVPYMQIFGPQDENVEGSPTFSIDTGLRGRSPAFHKVEGGEDWVVYEHPGAVIAMINHPRVNLDLAGDIAEQLEDRNVAALELLDSEDSELARTAAAGPTFRPRAQGEQREDDAGGNRVLTFSGWDCTSRGKCELDGADVVFNANRLDDDPTNDGIDGSGMCRRELDGQPIVLSCARLGLPTP